MLDCASDALAKNIIRIIQNIGRAEEKLSEIFRIGCFEHLSKHNEFFNSQHEDEQERLNTLRIQLQSVSAILEDVLELLNNADGY